MCELNPCLFGECKLTASSFRCHCKPGYYGDTCDLRHRPCSSNPCEARGECVETNDASFKCNCHAWWEGSRCEKRMVRIPYKPLSERMLHEPFWLGLITVTVVLAVLGLFWCAKRHFPEKLEKLLAEENDRGRPCNYSNYMSSSRCASVRERALGGGAAGLGGSRESASLGTGAGLSSGPPARSLLGRLGIRKPSLLVTTSTPAHHHPTASRTFSLDDLLKPSPSKGQFRAQNKKKQTLFFNHHPPT
uniref:EGF-like domain-containing protein n=1 Tax=Rhodnius prolixus TaxID=13249 RepID=T1HF05_RHOPR